MDQGRSTLNANQEDHYKMMDCMKNIIFDSFCSFEASFMEVRWRVHSLVHVVIEQPSGSWAYKQPDMVQLSKLMGLQLVGLLRCCIDSHCLILAVPAMCTHMDACGHVSLVILMARPIRLVTTTWLAFFGHDMAKCTHLKSDMRPGTT